MLLLYLGFLLVAYILYHTWWKRRGLPPGPTPLPFLGNALEIAKYPCTEEALKTWQKIYGDVFTFWSGERPIVAVCDYDKMVHYFVKNGELFQDRPDDSNYMNFVGRGCHGVIHLSGDYWKNQRRFLLHALRDFGLGKDLMEQRIVEECEDLFVKIQKTLSKSSSDIDLPNFIDVAIGSIINNLLFGYRYTEDKLYEFDDLKQRVKQYVTASGQPAALICRSNPQFYENLPYFKEKLQLVRKLDVHLVDFFKVRILEHVEDLKNEDMASFTPTDIVACYLKEKRKREVDGEDAYFTDEQLVGLSFDVWVAGQETTANTLGWAFAFMIHNQDAQKKVQEELDAVIGSDRVITTADRPQLPYLQAVCNETQRLANIVPTNVVHATSQNVEVDGYMLKKGTTITPLLCSVLSNEKYFPEPQKFKPERFLDDDGKLKKVDENIPFSLGKRQCLGEGLARMEIFLVLANILNRYKVLPGAELPSLERTRGFTVSPKPYKCKLQPRHL
ncbi:unnamed protein product [Bursaphelenchus xylophilus]|uniref:(pine wood nematode) hypothetical protein n=1 Tax=Bursaphelenchus xylophilus TaxID=6326 RepID=A0A1I7S4R9_BURXY|nr:unnamed protein product [Bursaphelenchus xylophilus]CAG9117328.1 unnamed protein product [Bursaphelenchus xylophilus]